MSKKLSIVILNYYCLDVIKDCLQSFKKHQPQLDYEIIIVNNDDNKDSFRAFSEQYPEIEFVQNTGNWGFSSGCNLGASIARGEHLLFLNPDTELTKSPAIDTMSSFLEDNPNVGIVSCRRIKKGKPEREITFINPWLAIGWIRALYRLVHKKEISKKFQDECDVWYPEWVAGSVVMISRVFFNKINGWSDKDFWMYVEDPDLCKKVHNNNKEIAILRRVELKHAHGGSSRKNPKTTAITKSEVVTSTHVFIQKYTRGLNRVSLHLVMIIDTLISWILRVGLTLVVFWKAAFKENLLTLLAIIRYYFNAVVRRTWKSKRLPPN